MIKTSLRKHLLGEIDKFLQAEGFISDELTQKGILALISFVSEYYEEGKRLYPEIVLTNDIDIFKTIPSRRIPIQSEPLKESSFRQAVKLCAPLSSDGWVIYLEITGEKINFGMLSTEMTDTSLSLKKQTSSKDTFPQDSTFLHICCIGEKVVNLSGLKGTLQVSLDLGDDGYAADNSIEQLSKIIASDCEEDKQGKISVYIEKLIDNTLKAGHGNLIGVVKDDATAINSVKNELSDGVYLDNPIDLSQLVIITESEKTSINSRHLRAYSSIASAMMNHDGITLISTAGRILGYHLFIKDRKADVEVVGGARSRAFESMKTLGLKACFYKSQDGNIKLHVNE